MSRPGPGERGTAAAHGATARRADRAADPQADRQGRRYDSPVADGQREPRSARPEHCCAGWRTTATTCCGSPPTSGSAVVNRAERDGRTVTSRRSPTGGIPPWWMCHAESPCANGARTDGRAGFGWTTSTSSWLLPSSSAGWSVAIEPGESTPARCIMSRHGRWRLTSSSVLSGPSSPAGSASIRSLAGTPVRGWEVGDLVVPSGSTACGCAGVHDPLCCAGTTVMPFGDPRARPEDGLHAL